MKKIFSFVILLAFCVPCMKPQSPLPLIPAPQKAEYGKRTVVIGTPLIGGIGSGVTGKSKEMAIRQMGLLGNILPLCKRKGVGVYCSGDPSLPEEGYKLSISKKGVQICASSPSGFFYGFQTLRRLLGKESMAGETVANPVLPVVEIEDYPRFPFRAMMLDVSRHFFTPQEIKKTLSLMAAYKLNKLQWHLTDDQGWRLPVDAYPLLTTVGATHPVNTRMTDFPTQHEWRTKAPLGPYAYTKDEIRDIVDYAANLNIEIIPEVEMPGHMAAAIAAYPWLSTRPDSIDGVRDLEGISKDIIDISTPETFGFLKTVLSETMDLFPSQLIHIGGDEAPTEAWRKHAGCRALADSLGVEGKNEEERFRKLQNWFTEEINAFCKQRGRRLMTWDEIITAPGADLDAAKRINPLMTAYDIVWDHPVEQADSLGIECVYSPFGPYYINRRYSTDRIGAGNGRDDLDRVYTHAVPQNKNLKGLQATFWTEYVCNQRDLEYLALPRLAAVAERAWTVSDPGLKDFNVRMKKEFEWLDYAGYNHSTALPEQPK